MVYIWRNSARKSRKTTAPWRFSRGQKWRISQLACKPGSVHFGGPKAMTIPLGRPLLDASLRPTRTLSPENRLAGLTPARCSYSVLLPVGFTLPQPLPAPRWALTPPFHPSLERGGLLSVALSLGSPPPGVTRHRVSMEPGLSSPHHLSTLQRAVIRPAGASIWRGIGDRSKKFGSAAELIFRRDGAKRLWFAA